jgi:iron complex outermembrane recepter protein
MGKRFRSRPLSTAISATLRRAHAASQLRNASFALLLTAGGIAQAQAQSAEEAKTLDSVSVVGAGSTRTTAAVSVAEIDAQVPGVAPQTLLASLPGVNVQTTDPFGLYEFGDSMRIRGFSANQVGVTLDGIPIETADTREGGPISRYVSSENLMDVQVSAGSGDVSQPSYHALGGAIRYTSLAPKGGDRWSGKATQTFGSYGLNRSFVRIDTPQWWEGGPSAYVSASRTRGEVWDLNEAVQASDHFEAKIRQDWDVGNLTLGWIWNQRDDYDVQSYNSDGSLSWDLHERITGDPEVDAEHYTEWKNGRRDSLVSLGGDFLFADQFGLKFTGYYENKHGYGIGGTPPSTAEGLYADAMAGTPGRSDIALLYPGNMTRREEIMGGDRYGLTAAVSWETEHNKLEVGGWYETYDFDQVRPLYNLDPTSGNLLKSALPIVVYYDNHFSTDVTQLYVKDTLKLMEDRLTLEFGAKGLDVQRDYTGIANLDDFNNNVTRSTSKKDQDWFQPQAGASFAINETVQVFANYAENFSAAPRLALTAGYFNPDIAPEESKNIDIGIRAETATWSGYIALYDIDYQNRIIALTNPDPLVVASEIYQNVGDIKTQGAEISGMWRPADGWRLGASVTYNKSEFQDNYFGYRDDGSGTQDVLRPVRGNEVPDAPEFMVSVNGGWEGEHFFANWDTKYTSKRYGDTMNTDEVDPTFIVNGSVGYKGNSEGFLAGGRLQLSVYNLLDEDDAIGAVFPNEDYGSYNLVAPRTAYLSLSYDF